MSPCNPVPTGEASPEALSFPHQSSCCCPHPSPQAARANRPPLGPMAQEQPKHCSAGASPGHPGPILWANLTRSPSPAD